ncbi:MAG: hypothetical protein HY814_13950 [Candidatus Riflebacteria bacterium]|nr:hypothetical protein [Candidatus Riflebacteria bacterium]
MTPPNSEEIFPKGYLLNVSMPWDHKLEKTVNGLLDRLGDGLAELKRRSTGSGYEEAVLFFDGILGDLEEVSSRSSWNFNTCPDRKVQDKAEKTSQLLAKLWSRLFTLRLPYDVLADVNRRLGTELSWDRRTYLRDLLRAFEQNGVHLDEVRKKKLYAIDSELAELGTQFAKVLKDREVLVPVTAEQAQPLEATSVRRDPKKGKTFLVLRENTFGEVMRFHPDRDFRARAYREHFVGSADLAPTLDRMRQLRRVRSRLVANKSYAAIEAENEGFTAAEVRAGLDELVARTTRRFRESMEDYRRLNDDKPVKCHDLLYLEEHAPSDGADPQVLQEYFSAGRTVKTLLQLSTELYGLTFKPEPGDAKHRIERYGVYGTTGRKLGTLTLDLYPRPGKYSHAACWTLRGRASHWPDRLADMGLVCNFKEKSLAGEAKGLLWDDVNTCFHEYGHVLHGLLINAEPLGAHSVPRSLVEVPSQVFENWATDPGVLDRLARHYKTGESLTPELRRLLYHKHQRFAASHLRTQVLYALFDLEFHEKTSEPAQAIWERLASTIFGAGFYPPGLPWFTRFGHLDGYGAKYWGYKFADMGKSQVYWYLVHRCPDMLASSVGDKLIDDLLRFGGLKKLNQMALDFTGVPLTGLPYILETLFDYPTLRTALEDMRKRPYRDALEAAFAQLQAREAGRTAAK